MADFEPGRLLQRLTSLGLRKEGEFTLHSGAKSKIFWDIENLFRYPYWVRIKAIEEFIWQIGLAKPRFIAGIRKGGLLLAEDIGECLDTYILNQEGYVHINRNPRGRGSGSILLDDVLTTGGTIREILARGINLEGSEITHIAVLINRSGETEIDGIPIIIGAITDRLEVVK